MSKIFKLSVRDLKEIERSKLEGDDKKLSPACSNYNRQE